MKYQGMRQEFGSAGAVCSITELCASKSAGEKGDVSKIRAPAFPVKYTFYKIIAKIDYNIS